MLMSAIIRELVNAGLEGERLIEAVERIEKSGKKERSANAERQARHRARMADQGVTSNVTRNGNVTRNASPPQSPPLTPPDPQTPPPYIPPRSVSDETAADAPSGDARTDLFGIGLASLKRQTGKRDDQVRQVIGRLLKTAHDDAAKVLDLIQDAERDRIADPIAWLTRCLSPPKQTKRQQMNEVLADWINEDDSENESGVGDPVQRFSTIGYTGRSGSG